MANKGDAHKKIPMRPDDFRSLAETMRKFVTAYDDVANQMDEMKVPLVEVTGMKTLRETTFKFIRGHLSTSSAAVMAAATGGADSDLSDEERRVIADEIARRLKEKYGGKEPTPIKAKKRDASQKEA